MVQSSPIHYIKWALLILNLAPLYIFRAAIAPPTKTLSLLVNWLFKTKPLSDLKSSKTMYPWIEPKDNIILAIKILKLVLSPKNLDFPPDNKAFTLLRFKPMCKVYNKYQGPEMVAPFHLLLVLKSLDDFKIWKLTSKYI